MGPEIWIPLDIVEQAGRANIQTGSAKARPDQSFVPIFVAQFIPDKSVAQQRGGVDPAHFGNDRDCLLIAVHHRLEPQIPIEAELSRIDAIPRGKPRCEARRRLSVAERYRQAVGKIDEMLHGMVAGTGGMHAAVRHWATQGALWRLLDVLLDRGFEVVLTADHGNVAGVGVGKPNVGVTAKRGERVDIFHDELLRSDTAKKFPGTIEWPDIGLPKEYFALIAPPLKAFFIEGRQTVSHGGICLEEVIVPFVTVARAS
jgi:hypothetical protein